MRKPSAQLHALFAFTVSAAFINGAPASASDGAKLTAAPPEGFEDLTSERAVLLDAYFGGLKLGEIQATIKPGFVTFKDPRSVAGLIPDVALVPELATNLTGALPTNVSLACGPTRHKGCGVLQPTGAGVILDEERFRIEIFVHPDLLARPDPTTAYYLEAPSDQPSLVSLFGAAISGSSHGRASWHLQNRSIASVGNLRVRSDSSVTERDGLEFDNLTLEADRRDWRFLGGVFWAPGTELVGRRRIIGLGATTQIDTRRNRTELLGTPLDVHLQQSAKVDLLVDGRLVSSRIYPAGNRLIDTATLPNGSYQVTVRVQEDGRPAREEQRFFTKGSSMAPLGRPLLSAFVGLLPSSTRTLSPGRTTPFYQAGAAYRLTPGLGVDATVLGTTHKGLLETGLVYHSPTAQLRLGALVSTSGDRGIAVRAASVGDGPLSLSLDLRKILSHDGGPLLPVSSSRGSFSEEAELGFADRGSYTQALSIVSYRIDRATFRLTGLYRKNAADRANYSIGTSVEMPIFRSNRWDLVMMADARKSERDFSSFVGFRFLAHRGEVSVSGSAGLAHQGARARPNRLVGEAQAAWHRQLADQSRLAADVAVGQNVDGGYSRAGVSMRSRTLNGRADVLHQFGDPDTTQFAAAFDTGIVVTGHGVGVAGRDTNDTGIVVSVDGGGSNQDFDVLVNEVARGTVRDGSRLILFLEPYQEYDVRVRSRASQISDFDAAARAVTLYPGNVAELEWAITPLFIMFARAVSADGQPIASADVTGSHGVARTDSDGYFQIETNRADQLRLTLPAGAVCTIPVQAAQPADGFVSAGDLMCR